MDDWREYVRRTEPSMRILFDSLRDLRDSALDQALPTLISGAGGDDEIFAQFSGWKKGNKAAPAGPAPRPAKAAPSVTSLAKSILQFAYIVIDKYSANAHLAPHLQPLVGQEPGAVKFCVGRPIRAVPLGLVVYAGRHHFAGGAGPARRDLPRRVFEALSLGSFESVALVGPEFDRVEEFHVNFAHHCLDLLGWKTLGDYHRDLALVFHDPHVVAT